MTATATAPIRHLRPRRDGEAQQTTTVELFFDLVYVFAVMQLSHQIVDDLSVAGVARAAFLLLVVWWAWIYTTWMVNWFDPANSSAVRGVLTGVMLGSLLMAAALPEAFGEHAQLFAASYVALQVGRNPHRIPTRSFSSRPFPAVCPERQRVALSASAKINDVTRCRSRPTAGCG